ncbi:matrixin family metalloprotease [Listeria seeligeri]|uniref:Matrixin superfamily n=2 Tax=Listeria TaxID=1637 RepID=A0ABP2K109_9LIST|nr:MULTISPECIES: matrixin family metalloprotease [Listeria]EFR88110.1 matrixin superfamily [Listeria marthii FSL S4-120]MBC1805938.1 matrixin family metalloprotease [Listeria cossartiae subsp. cayugensis]MBC1968948.1 matrixin family metalloprotease [Listeria marthii]MBC2084417.1 matrixin family metalloprotease [Listeria marthii]MBF2362372.1 matrixin family metalloprotease [Listeria marthii]
MKKMAMFMLLLSILLACSMPQKANATAYTNLNGSFPAVSHGSIWYTNNSTYSTWRINQGANIWHKNGSINLINKNFSTYKLSTGQTAYVDVTVLSSNYYDSLLFSGVGHVAPGVYVKSGTSRTNRAQRGEIHLNDYVMWNTQKGWYYSNNQIYYTIAHEFGHSLGLGHNPYKGNIMTPLPKGSSVYFGRDDNDSYEARWGRNSFWGGGY